MSAVYLDYNATSPLDPLALEEMRPFLRGAFGNPSSVHSRGREARAAIDLARERTAAFLGASPSEIFFTSGGSEGNNLAVKGAALAASGRRHLVTTAVEHSSCRESFAFLESAGFRVTRLPVDSDGVPDMAALERSVGAETALVSCIHTNNETGVISPVRRAGEIAAACGALFHTDVTQSAGRIALNLSSLPVDIATVSSHKLCGPKGAGAVFVRKGVSVPPLIHGGGQERGKRSGTENVAAIAGFGMACEITAGRGEEDMKKVAALKSDLERFILSDIEGSWINGGGAERAPNTSNFGISGADGESLVIALDIEGVCVSNGSACSEGNVDPSAVLLATGLAEDRVRSSLRVSMGRFTTADDVDAFKKTLVRCLDTMRASAAP